MNKYCKSVLIGIFAASVTAAGMNTGAFAAQGDASGSASAQSAPQHHWDKDRVAKMREHFAKRLAKLHDKLKLNADQETAWKTYMAAITPQPHARPERPNRGDWQKLSAPERMEKMLNRMKEAENRLGNALAATKTFYATLTPEQQKIFNDNVGMGPMQRHGHHHDHDKK